VASGESSSNSALRNPSSPIYRFGVNPFEVFPPTGLTMTT
jgi:hypothetical protein